MAISSDKPAAKVSASSNKRKKKEDEDEKLKKEDRFKNRMANSMYVVAYNAACEALWLEQKNVREMQLAIVKETDPETKKIYDDCMHESRTMVMKLKHRFACIEDEMNSMENED